METNGRNIVLIGSPGVGKGVQAERLSSREGIPHLSTGALIRDEIARGSALGAQVRKRVERGGFVDDETILALVSLQLGLPGFQRGFVMDGFPRTLSQAEKFDYLLEGQGRRVNFAINIDAPEDVIRRRLTGRLVCSECERSYHVEFQPPVVEGVCDVCRGAVDRRPDDSAEVHRKRILVFRELTRPVLDYYRERGVLVEVDGSPGIEAVAQEIQDSIAVRG